MACGPEMFDCSICLQTLEEPVTTACGHSYCMKCIYTFWETNTKSNRRGPYSCPTCQKSFRKRPELQKSTTLANLLQEHQRRTTERAPPDGGQGRYAAPGDVRCDVCTDRKRKAHVFCLVCVAYYCHTHLQPHLDVPPLKKHRLARASSAGTEADICCLHRRRLDIYCRTDRQLLCPLCVLEHKAHDIVTAEEEINARKREVERTREEVSVKRMVSESKITQLMNAEDSIRDAAWKVCDDFEQRCAEHVRLFRRYADKKCVEMREKVGELEKDGVDWTKRRLGELERQVHELRRLDNKLHLLSQTEDATGFLQGFQDLDNLPALTDSQEGVDPLEEFVSAQKDRFKQMCDQESKELFFPVKDFRFQTPRHGKTWDTGYMEIRSRKDISAKYVTLEMNPDTVHVCLRLSKTKKKISWGSNNQAHPNHPHRFARFYQVLCREGLKNNCYWEVTWDGGIVEVAMSYKGISRKGAGKASCFGHNEMSWKLVCAPSSCTFWHNNLHKGRIPPAYCCRVGVHLQYDQGKLSFYSVSDQERLTLLHQVQTTFTEPLYAGFSVDLGAELEICNI